MFDVSKLSANVPIPDSTFLGKDGLLHCQVCGSPVETIVENEMIGRRKVRCICLCRIREQQADHKRKQIEKNDRNRRICFRNTELKGWTFGKDDGSNENVIMASKSYAQQFEKFRKSGKGLLFWGDVGTGKTFAAACIANAVIDQGYTALMTNFAELTNKLQESFSGRQAYIDSLNNYSLLVIDDLGAERKSEYMQEIVFNIIDARYRAGLPMIITTNLTIEEIKKPAEIGNARIYDRVLEICHPIKVAGESHRRSKIKSEYFEMQKQLGL